MTNHNPIGFVWSDSTVLCADSAYAEDSVYDPDKDDENESGHAHAVFEWDEDGYSLMCEDHLQPLMACAGFDLSSSSSDEETKDEDIDICNLTYEYLHNLPTLCVGQSDDLKIETDRARVWLARTSYADGERFKHRVSIENLRAGKWETVYDYEALTEDDL